MIMMLGCGGLVSDLYSKMTSVRSTDKFYRKINKYDLAVVMFYKVDKATRKDDPDLYKRIKNLGRMFKATSRMMLYKEANVLFIQVNVAKRSELNDLAQEFNVKQFPTFLLFKNSVPLRDKNKNIITLTGLVLRQALKNFIDKHLKDDIEDIIEEKAEIRKRRLEEARLRSYYYGSYYSPYYHYPYYYHPYSYGHIGFGFCL